jgi:2-keto-4-pentenoate hydratase/2-oxohepta-3-ene-1,7-dioic acid hydratase in catechol pathway
LPSFETFKVIVMVRFARFESDAGEVSYGVVSAGDELRVNIADGCPFNGTLRDTGKPASVKRFLAPVEPPMVICIGLNYFKHADELGLPYPKNPVIFTKPPTSIAGHGARVAKPRITQKMDYEVELAVVIGKSCKDVTVEEAVDYILGYTVANDLSTRDWQKVPELAGSQWCRSKSFDGFSPLGPVLVTKEDLADPTGGGLRLTSSVNGEPRQDSSTDDLIFKVPEIVSFLSAGSTIPAGTVILTGTPAGVAEGMKGQPWLKAGDRVITRIQDIGSLEVEIVADPSEVKCYANMSKL